MEYIFCGYGLLLYLILYGIGFLIRISVSQREYYDGIRYFICLCMGMSFVRSIICKDVKFVFRENIYFVKSIMLFFL